MAQDWEAGLRLGRVGRAGAAVLGCAIMGGAVAGPLVAVDIGHNLWAWGATSARGRGEFYFNRDLAHAMIVALQQRHVSAQLVNDDGLIPSLVDRTTAVPGASFFVSIHHDSVPAEELKPWTWEGQTLDYDDTYAGHSLFVSRRNAHYAESLACARAMAGEVQQAGFVPTRKNAIKHPYADEALVIHDYDNLVVLYRNPLPAVLFESGVIKNRDEELLLRDPARQQKMAEALADGIVTCLEQLVPEGMPATP